MPLWLGRVCRWAATAEWRGQPECVSIARPIIMAWSKLSRHERGYGSAWTKTRLIIIARDKGLCQPCLRNGKPVPFSQVDHVKPKAIGGTDDHDNLQCICAECHKLKTDAEAASAQGRTIKPTIGADGWPI